MALQRELRLLVRQESPRKPLRFVAGLDGAFSADGRHCIGGVVAWDLLEQRVVEHHTATRKLMFPYIPGLLSFRELPVWVAALRKLRCDPDVLMCDGHGFAHPRRFGIACHIGVYLRVPSIGCAKSRLVGMHDEPPKARGSKAALIHDGEVIGSVLRTQRGIRPVYVSVGHEIDLRTAEDLVLSCATKYRLPEPTRLADHLVDAMKRQLTI